MGQGCIIAAARSGVPQVPIVQFRGLRPDPGCKMFARVVSSEKLAARGREGCILRYFYKRC